MLLFRESAFGPINKTVRPHSRAMQVVHAAGECATIVPKDSFFGHAVIISVDQTPNFGWRSHPHLFTNNANPLWQHQVVGKNCAAVEYPIAIIIHQAKNPVRSLLGLHRRWLIRAA